jgi:PAS domain S-box-containing protein/putative nucleotidyltransferase with HDIG domain
MHIRFSKDKIIEQIDRTEHFKTNVESIKNEREQLEVEYKSIFDLAPYGIIKVDLKGFVTSCNEAFLSMAGYSREEIIGKHFTRLPTVRVKDVHKYVKIVTSILAGKTIKPFMFEWIDRNGSTRLGEIHAALIKVNGHTTGIVAVLWDITEREKTAAALRDSEKNLKKYLECAPDAVYISDLKGTFLYGNRKAEELTGYDKEELIGRSFLDLKLLPAKHLVKAVELLALNAIGRPTGPDEFELVKKAGNHVWVEITTTPIKEQDKIVVIGFVRDITERKQSEEKRQAILETAIDGFWLSNLEGELLEVNDSYCQMTGYTREELLKMSIKDLEVVESQEEVVQHIKRITEQGYDRFETKHKCKDGRIINIEISTNYLDVGEGRFFVFARDITKRKRAEEALADEATRRRILIEQSKDGIVVVDQNGKVCESNQQFAEMLGYSQEEIRQLYVWDWEYLFPREKVLDMILSVDETGDHFETQHRRKDGTIYDVEISTNGAVFEGQKLIFCVCRDITESKQAKEALEASEQRYRLLVENANEAIMVAQDGMLKFANAKTTEFTGYSSEELSSMPFVELIHPDDRDMVVGRYLRRLKGEALPGVYSFRFIRKDGSVGWAEINAVLIEWEGKAATLNFISDISERRQAEEKLGHSYEKLQKTMDLTIGTIALIAETRDPYTAGHQRRVAKLASAIAAEMGFSEEQIETIRVAGLLHDIGKVNVPTEILSKPGALSEIEFNLIKSHPQVGNEILKKLELPWKICPIILQHHERMDGSGYPKGTTGQDISAEAKVLSVADVVEAISSHRPYRPSLGIDKALEEISQNRGTLYDADVVDACLRLINEKGFKFE